MTIVASILWAVFILLVWKLGYIMGQQAEIKKEIEWLNEHIKVCDAP